MPDDKTKDNESLRTVQRAIDILNCFSFEQAELSLTEIANKIDLAKSTTTRLLATLENNGFVQKNPNSLKYKLGHRLYYLGSISGRSIKVRQVAKPIMDDLRDFTKETVNLHVLEQHYRVCIEQSEGVMSIRHLVRIGERLPLWAGAGGKAILAYQGEAFQESILQTVDNGPKLQKLRAELATIASEHFTSSMDEREVGLAAVASPIFDVNGEVKASLSVSGPSVRFSEERIMLLKDHVGEAAKKISMMMGHMEAAK
ncbi:IclR family transcriptional regulator [Paenibacillus darwinianus]|uniref:Glycerol operon regulatory protein n=1 Tax=Paenibacillus darwinianus TaxID=1380763 RepID=A0A9W5W8M9_9BACL|nr:IclR family transcriptional regulator [Paenibacillus darwinianus]EXX90688.1 IclR family transcriptional regulator [Paenibacillus darwinianus]EXX91550.1 IclR family transcriptional regulator [Paenibacillus darwinianus]EXX92077.1 IclR family transcriptional regulator [Paenibacillus darwinianus]